MEFQTRDAYHAAFNQLLAAARQRLCIYDHTLEQGGFNDLARFDLLREFCLSGGAHRIEILLDDPTYVQKQCPRLIALLGDFSHVLEIRQSEGGSARPAYSFALADRNAWLKCFEKNALPGQFALDDPSGVVPLQQQFDALWERAPGSVSATTLGLG